jgi:protein-tyrosine phosphatase
MLSRLIGFEELRNTRDLGGMTAAGGFIKPGKLLRSGALYTASPADIAKLAKLTGCVVDLRNAGERSERPDPKMPRVKYVSNPVLAERTAGISKEEGADEEAATKLLLDFEKARAHMSGLYRQFVTEAYSIAQYRAFIDILLERCSGRKAVLWHCTAGKDRAGTAAVIIEEILGVPREDIRADYMSTNIHLERDIVALSRMLHTKLGLEPGSADAAMRCHFGAREDYIDALYDECEKRWGGMQGFIENGLGVTSAETARLRRYYIEP